MRLFFSALVFSMALAPAAFAGDVRVVLHDGRADVVAHNAPLSQVLAEWARVGQVQIENAERIPGPPVTLELRDVPEAAALDVLLRAASGFIAVPRSGAPGPSRFARILVLASSTAPAVTPATAAAARSAMTPPPTFQTFPAPGVPRVLPAGAAPVLGPDGRPVADDQDDAPPPVNAPPPVQSMPPGFAPPQQQPTQPHSPMPAQGAAVPGAATPGVVVAAPGAVPGQPPIPKRPQ